MMGLGTNRDYKTRGRRTRERLARHSERMSELVKQGLSREQASKQAFDELFGKTTKTSDERKRD